MKNDSFDIPLYTLTLSVSRGFSTNVNQTGGRVRDLTWHFTRNLNITIIT